MLLSKLLFVNFQGLLARSDSHVVVTLLGIKCCQIAYGAGPLSIIAVAFCFSYLYNLLLNPLFL